MINIAYFISPHGYGHAARAAAVMAALQTLDPAIHFHIFTRVPECFFQASMDENRFTWYSLKTDIGLVQSSALSEDLNQTVAVLNTFLPFDQVLTGQLTNQLTQLACQLVLCDIAPLGIKVAEQAGIRSVLIENFTWDWIYQGYLDSAPGLHKAITYLQTYIHAADYHIQTQPFCHPYNDADLTVNPVSRKPNLSIEETRAQLEIPDEASMVLVTMGGIPEKNYQFLQRVQAQNSVYCVISGVSDDYERHNSLIMLPHHSRFYHPNLTHAADLVIGKLGYSTLAETYDAGIPFAYISRPGFRETESLATFADAEVRGWAINAAYLQSGEWLDELQPHLQRSRVVRETPNGADEIADFIEGLVSSGSG